MAARGRGDQAAGPADDGAALGQAAALPDAAAAAGPGAAAADADAPERAAREHRAAAQPGAGASVPPDGDDLGEPPDRPAGPLLPVEARAVGAGEVRGVAARKLKV